MRFWIFLVDLDVFDDDLKKYKIIYPSSIIYREKWQVVSWIQQIQEGIYLFHFINFCVINCSMIVQYDWW